MKLVAAVDLGGTKTSAGLVDSSGVLLGSVTAPTPGSDGPEAVLGTVVRLVRGLGGNPAALGVGSAGVIDPARGVVVSATEVLVDWAGTDLRGRLGAELGVPVAVDNDIHAHALGETWRGAGRDVRDLLFVAVGTGVGASLVLDGRVRRGAHSVAGHAGHVPAAAAAGIHCTCGATGHLEAVAAGPAMLAAYNATTDRTATNRAAGGAAADRSAGGAAANQSAGGPAADRVAGGVGVDQVAGGAVIGGVAGGAAAGQVAGAGADRVAGGAVIDGVAGGAAAVEAPAGTWARAGCLAEVDRRARVGDRAARSVLDAGATALGSVLGGLVNLVDPEVVVVGGGVAGCGEHWWRPLRSAFAAELLPALEGVPIVPAALGADGALIGAARLAWQVLP